MTMNKFEYGVAAYLTILTDLKGHELPAFGLTHKKRDKLLTQRYQTRLTPELVGKDIARFQCERTIDAKTIQTAYYFDYSPRIEAMPLNEVIGIVGHEANHSLRKNINNGGKNIWHNMLGIGVFAAGMAYNLKNNTADFDPLGFSFNTIGSAIIAKASTIMSKNLMHFYNEKKAYRHQGAIDYMIDPAAKSVDDLMAEKADVKNKITAFTSFRDRFMRGYPSDNLQQLWRLQGATKAAQHNLHFDQNRVDLLMKHTEENARKYRFQVFRV